MKGELIMVIEVRISNILKKLIERKGITQSELASYLNVKPQTISMYCSGKSFPEFQTLIKLAEYFEVSLDYLVTGKRNENRYLRNTLHLDEDSIENIQCRPSVCPLNEVLGDKNFYVALEKSAIKAVNVWNMIEAVQNIEEAKKNIDIVELIKSAVLLPAREMQDYFIEFFNRYTGKIKEFIHD